MKNIILVSVSLLIYGCASHNTTLTPLTSSPNPIEATGKSFYLSMAPDGKSRSMGFLKINEDIEEGSGKVVSDYLFNYLKKNSYAVTQAKKEETEVEALNMAESYNVDYMIYPKVNIWNDPYPATCRGNEIAEMRNADEADIDIMIFDVKTKKVVNSYNVASYGCPHVINGQIPIGVKTPESQLEEALKLWKAKQQNDNTRIE